MIRFLKYCKNPRIGIANAIKLCFLLLRLKREVILSANEWYKNLRLRPNHSDWIAFDQVFIAMSYGGLEKLRPKRVIDAGANIGLSVAYFCSRLGCDDVVALEPESENFKLAQENTRQYPGVKIIKGALWPRSVDLHISNKEEAGSIGFQVSEVERGKCHSADLVRAYSIQEIMNEKGWDYVDLIKIDIEGAEYELFQDENVKDWINRVAVIVIELHDWLKPGCSKAFFNALQLMPNYELALSGENIVIRNLSFNK